MIRRTLAVAVLLFILAVIALFSAAAYHDSNLAAWQHTEELHKL
jgi:hypothetical protein